MAEIKRAPGMRPQQFEIAWGDDSQTQQIYVDEMICQLVNERAYVTFGQARYPMSTSEDWGGKVEVRPVLRLILTQEKLRRIIEVLGGLLLDKEPEKK